MQSNTSLLLLTLFTILSFLTLLASASPIPAEVDLEGRICRYGCTKRGETQVARSPELEVAQGSQRQPSPNPEWQPAISVSDPVAREDSADSTCVYGCTSSSRREPTPESLEELS